MKIIDPISGILKYVLDLLVMILKLTLIRCINVFVSLIARLIKKSPMMKMKECAIPSENSSNKTMCK
jgi:hypothetical protein